MRRRKPCIEQYIPYLLGQSDPQVIDILMRKMEEAGERPDFDRESFILEFAAQYGDPESLPPDIYMTLGKEEDTDDLDGSYEVKEESESDVESSYSYEEDDQQPGKERIDDLFSTRKHYVPVGGHLELWHPSKIWQVRNRPAESQVHAMFPNICHIVSHKKFQEELAGTKVKVFRRLGVAEFELAVKGGHPEAVVMDPPLMPDGISEAELVEMFRILKKPEICNTFIFVWVDPENFSLLARAVDEAGLSYCDAMQIELLEPDMSQARIISPLGFPRTSRPIFLYRTNAGLKREVFAQQRTKDVGYGISRVNGKSRGRRGMPMVPHQAVEGMLPVTNPPRCFIEFWPTRMSANPRWKFFDEDL
jgi:hypothetical protein